MKKSLFALVVILIFIPNVARADVSLLVLESVGVSGEFSGSGHTTIYFSNICADSPVQLRLCRAGERGVVISNYPTFGNDASHEWMATPLLAYLYGVENERDIPLYANGEVRNFLRETYRRNHLRTFIPDSPNGAMPEGGWQTMLTMSFNRDIYSLNVNTTAEEDAQFLREFNSLPNTGGRFNIFTRNCADFARNVINRYFPGAARRDWINDFGITTPKAIARSLTRYASRRPERLFHITKYTQVAGPIWRSYDNRNFTEMAFTSRKYLVPSLIFDPPLLGIFAGTYLMTGRFNLHQAYRQYATPQIARLNLERHLLRESRGEHHTDTVTIREIEERIETERARLLGNRQSWEAYRANFAPILENAIAQGLFQDSREVRTFFRDLELQSEPAMDADGGIVLNVRYYGEQRTLGITRNNLLSANSDRELALKLMLAMIHADLNAPERNRSSLQEFRSNWEMMRQLLAAYAASSEARPRVERNGRRFLESTPPTTARRRLEKLVFAITH